MKEVEVMRIKLEEGRLNCHSYNRDIVYKILAVREQWKEYSGI
jgi:hypothetical protein